ncbi:Phosphatidylglycerophosphatase GEP4, mitochondrial [Erysiphe neolycopersici]|uniref:Phosphatidylglycerophosphatase GEP4, mitochondrial n=1 Tax=Erysiphe neolycopersici TaxID=212602 RepID=A0A420HHA3_9PEZI|nr:Phosphatidylglycerophosphatase GEP4, mitochondrial [Erysiphe neolycopersici]
MNALNVSATLNLFRLISQPNLCLPQSTISTFAQIPVPLDDAFVDKRGEKKTDIKAVILDKDNCFATPHTNYVHESYQKKFEQLKKAYPDGRLLIVSNTAGTSSCDPTGMLASELELATGGVKVFRHTSKKPGCREEIIKYFRYQCPELGVKRPDQIAVIGDRLMTDVLMANQMGSYAIWLKEGLIPPEESSLAVRLEQRFASFLIHRNIKAPEPVARYF